MFIPSSVDDQFVRRILTTSCFASAEQFDKVILELAFQQVDNYSTDLRKLFDKCNDFSNQHDFVSKFQQIFCTVSNFRTAILYHCCSNLNFVCVQP